MVFGEWGVNGLKRWSGIVGSIESSTQRIRAHAVNVNMYFPEYFSLHTFSRAVLVTELERN